MLLNCTSRVFMAVLVMVTKACLQSTYSIKKWEKLLVEKPKGWLVLTSVMHVITHPRSKWPSVINQILFQFSTPLWEKKTHRINTSLVETSFKLQLSTQTFINKYLAACITTRSTVTDLFFFHFLFHVEKLITWYQQNVLVTNSHYNSCTHQKSYMLYAYIFV